MPKGFQNISRIKRIPEATAKELGIQNLAGENKLSLVLNAKEDAHIYLSGAVGGSWWDDSGILEKEVREALAEIPKGTKIHAHINSEGGSVQEGLGIYNAFKERSQDITAHIDGYACSIASVIPLAASKVISPKSAIWMIHCASCYCGGNADDMEKSVTMLREHDKMLAEILSTETGQSLDKINADMKAETWIRGSLAVEYGLADETGEDEVEDKQHTLPQAWLDRCKNIPANIYNALAPRKESGAPLNSATPPKADNNKQNQTQESTMNKKSLVVLLQTQGIKNQAGEFLTESSTDAEFETALNALAKRKDVDAAAKMETIEAKLALAETRRLTDKVNGYVTAGKITKAEVPIFVSAMQSDEEGTVSILDAKESQVIGGENAGFSVSRIELGNTSSAPLDVALRSFEPVQNILTASKGNKGAAYTSLIADWDGIFAEACRRDARRGMQPMNANSISGFTTAFLLSGSLTPLQNVWAPLMAFSKDYSPDPYKPLATPTLKNPTAASSTLTDATNFAQGNSTVGALTATMHQYTQPFQISNTDLNSGLRMEDLVTINRAAFANKVIDVALAPVTAANFPATPVISAAAAFGFSDSNYLQGQLQKSDIANLILDGTYMASLTNTPGFFQQAGTVFGSANAWQAFGWNMIAKNSRWTGAGNNIKGFACNPQAIIGIMGLPINPVNFPGGLFNVETVTIPGLNISVAIYTWWDVNARTMWTSYDVMAGFALGDATAGVLVASNTPS